MLVRAILVLFVLAASVGAAQRNRDAIRADYLPVWTELSARTVIPLDEKPAHAALRERAWALVAEWAATYVAAHRDTTAEALLRAVSELNPHTDPPAPGAVAEVRPSEVPPSAWGVLKTTSDFEDFWHELDSYRVTGTAVRTRSGAYALALTAAYWGRLVLVSEEGVLASVEIDRRGTFHPLPDTSSGHERFYVDARSDDWPTSYCRGGELTIWEWDGGRLYERFRVQYSDHGPAKGWGVHLRGRWLKVYTRGGLAVLTECCACDTLKAVRKIRVGPDRIDDLGIEYVVREFPVVDAVIAHAVRGQDVPELAAPAVTQELVAIFDTLDIRGPEFVALLNSWDVRRHDQDEIFDVGGDDMEFSFRMVRHDGRPYVVALLKPHLRAAIFLAAARAKFEAIGGKKFSPVDSQAAAYLVALERPDLVPDEDDFQNISYCLDLWRCGHVPR